MKVYFEKKVPAFRVNEANAVFEVLRLEMENYRISLKTLMVQAVPHMVIVGFK